MKMLVIPDVHLKPHIFHLATDILEAGKADRAVCLMDIADDWSREAYVDLYAETNDAAIRFAKAYPETLWCWGNHDICYMWNMRETGYSVFAQDIVERKIRELKIGGKLVPAFKHLCNNQE